MTASRPQRPTLNLPAYVLALALLVGLAATGVRVVGWMRMAPSTAVPPQALAERPEVGQPWRELTTAQKQVLYPLANHWSGLNEAQKHHWLKLAAGFPSLAPQEQERLLARLSDWASLSAQQRSQARLNYAATSTLPPDSKRAKWQAYQALSEAQRQRLAERAAAPRTSGAAPAVRPASKRLAKVPAASNMPAALPNPPKIPRPDSTHVPQALPVPAPVIATPVPAPAVVETRPVETPSATPTALPALPLEEPAAPQEPPPMSGSAPPLHPPQ